MDILTELRTTILNDIGQNLFWSQAQLLNALNAAQLSIRGEASDSWTMAEVTVVPAVTYTPDGQLLDSTLGVPASIMVPQLLVGPKGEAFTTTLADMERNNKFWRTNVGLGEPVTFVEIGLRQLQPYPSPDQEYEYDLWGLAWPAQITLASLDLEVLDHNYRHAVLMNAAARLLLPTQPQAAMLASKESTEHLALYRRHLRARGGVFSGMNRLQPKNEHRAAWYARLGSPAIAWRA